MPKNVTLRLDDDLVQKARHMAVDHHMSLSGWVASLIQSAVQGEIHREQAKRRALRRIRTGYDLGGIPLSREETHAG